MFEKTSHTHIRNKDVTVVTHPNSVGNVNGQKADFVIVS